VHVFRSADNGVDRTGFDAQQAPMQRDSSINAAHAVSPAVRAGERFRPPEQPRQFCECPRHRRAGTGDVGITLGNCLRVWTTAWYLIVHWVCGSSVSIASTSRGSRSGLNH